MVQISRIRERMGVIAADGRRIGFVDGAIGDHRVRLTSLVAGHGYHHTIPVAWIDQIDRYVHLNKESRFVATHWERASAPPPDPMPRSYAGS
jgi:hypothetical protein